jgi:hypothetical protein
MKSFRNAALARSKPVEKSKLYSITQGTVYDVAHQLKSISRDITHGDFGKVSDAVLILRYHEKGRLCVQGYHYGPSSIEIVQSMCNRIAIRLTKYDY